MIGDFKIVKVSKTRIINHILNQQNPNTQNIIFLFINYHV